MHLVHVVCLCALGMGPLRGEADAQYAPAEGFRLERWASTPTSRDGFAVTRPAVLEHGVWSGQFVGSYTQDALVLRHPDEHGVVAHRMGAELTGAVGLWNIFEFYARLPATLFSLGHDVLYQQTTFQPPGGVSLADMAVGMTALLFAWRGFQVGTRAELLMPTGNRRQLTGDSALAPRVHGLLEYASGRVAFVLNGGLVYRPQRDYALARIGNELEWGGLVCFDAQRGLEFLLESFGTLGLRERRGPSASDTFNLLLGLRYSADTGRVRMRSGVAIGTGLSEAIGDPDFRTLFSLGVEPRPVAAPLPAVVGDRDRDGIDDDVDECPAEREDRDGFEDGDGCPEQDNDQDGVLDTQDQCPQEAGDSLDGCPVVDTDGDGIADERDRCPKDAENLNGARDTDGCPERDQDADGLDDDADACPDVFGLPEYTGCRAHARFAGEQIALSPLVFAQAELAPESAPVLDDVAVLLSARPLLHAEIVVWSADSGLSERRGQAVAAGLVGRGIPMGRLNLRVALPAPSQPREGVDIHLRAAPAP